MNPTDPNNPNSSNPFGGTPLPDHNTLGSTPPPPPPVEPTPTFTPPIQPTMPESTFTNPVQPFNPAPAPTPPQPDLGSVFTPAPQEQPPLTSPAEPAPTFTSQPSEPPLSNIPPTSIPNPEPPIAADPMPTFTPPEQPPAPNSFAWSSTPQQPVSTEAPIQAEAAPTDLSHLINTGDNTAYTPPLSQPETLVSPPNGGAEVPNIPTENHKGGVPKWAIGVGVALLLAVVGASAYFILGIGRTTPEPASAPATTNVAPALTASTAPAVQTPPATNGFGDLTASPSATASASPVSALERLRQQQQQNP